MIDEYIVFKKHFPQGHMVTLADIKKQEGYGLNEGELWRHAVSSALIAKELAQKMDIKQTSIVFTAALLKDIGKIILDQHVAHALGKINELVGNKNFSFREAEKKVLGIDHAELGGLVAKKWNFSNKLISIISNHHLTKETEVTDKETAIVYLADTVCMMMGIGGGVDGLAYRFHEEILENLKITPMDLQEIIAGFGENIQKVEDMINTMY